MRGRRRHARRAVVPVRGGAGRRCLVALRGEPSEAAPGSFGAAEDALGPMEKVLFGPSDDPDGNLNLFGGLRRAMAKCGYRDLKEFQKVGLVIDR